MTGKVGNHPALTAGRRFRLLCLSPYPDLGPSVRHRITGYRQSWADSGIDLTLWSFMGPFFYRIRRRFGLLQTPLKFLLFALALVRLILRLPFVGRFDAVIIHRECFPLGPPLFELLITKLQPAVYYDVDDAIWFPPSNDVNQRGAFRDTERTAKIMAACREVVVCNPFLEAYARQHNASVHIIPTTYPGNHARRRDDNAPLTIVWIGNLGNAFYLDSILPVLERLAERQHFVLRLIGGEDIFGIHGARFATEHLLWREELEDQWLKDADIGIMPLVERPYEQGKCAFKVVQYFAAGLPVVASPVGMNRDVIEPGANGFLAMTSDEWAHALGTLLGDADCRHRMGQAGLATYQARFTRAAGADAWKAILDDRNGQVGARGRITQCVS